MTWLKIKGFNNYSVSSDGSVRNDNNLRLLRPTTNSRGYLYVVLSNNGKTTTKKVHRLVAETFIDNPDNKPQVNHIDGNKQNNNVSNLEWTTAQENTNHFWQFLDNEYHKQNRLNGHKNSIRSYSLSEHPRARKVLRVDDNKVYNCLTEAALDSNTTESLISQVCRGKRHTTGGYKWRYV